MYSISNLNFPLYRFDEDVEDVKEANVAERFIKSINKQQETCSAITLTKLENHHSEAFQILYDKLKAHNVIELDPLIHLLARISSDENLKSFLRLHCALSKLKRPQADSNRVKENVVDNLPSQPYPITPMRELATNVPLSIAKPVNGITPFPRSTSEYRLPSATSTPSISAMASLDFEGAEKTPSVYSSATTASGASNKVTDVRLRRRHKMDRKDWSFLSLDYKPIDWSREKPVKSLRQLPVYEQEALLVEDLLHVLVGIEGSYIRLHPVGVTGRNNGVKHKLIVDESADKLLLTLATKIILICPLYSSVIHFIDENERGLVNQAIASAMRGVIKDYFTLIAQLETQFRKNNLTMQKMWYYLQPYYSYLDILKYFSSTINANGTYGGAVLSILHTKTVSLIGNVKLLDFCIKVTIDASVPYFEIFHKWMTEGIIQDTHHEFFIQDTREDMEDGNLTNDSLWESRYQLDLKKLPMFFNRFQEKILNTGKYLAIMRICGFDPEAAANESLSRPLGYTIEEKVYSNWIESAHHHASKQLLRLLVKESDLLGHLYSVKHYFFMDQGDYIVQFMDMAEDELSKEIGDMNPSRLSSLLELCLRTSSMKTDTHHEEVQIELMDNSLLTQLSDILSKGTEDEDDAIDDGHSLRGFESVALQYHVKWPLSLILSHRNIACYQMLFRHLFYCKYVERTLESVWKDNKMAKVYALKAVTGYAEAFALRQKMLNFVQNLSYYMTVEVIEPHFHTFINKIDSFTQLDELSHEHSNFVEECLKDCMLTQKFALQYMVLLLRLCMSFAQFMRVSLSLYFLS